MARQILFSLAFFYVPKKIRIVISEDEAGETSHVFKKHTWNDLHDFSFGNIQNLGIIREQIQRRCRRENAGNPDAIVSELTEAIQEITPEFL